MTEEQVTKTIMGHLCSLGWSIVAFDFPQSGTGKALRPNNTSDKNKGSIMPDIVAVKNSVCLFFENKDRVALGDFKKTAGLIDDNQYTDDIATLLSGYEVSKIYYGVGFPTAKRDKRYEAAAATVHFVIGASTDGEVEFLHNPFSIAL